MQVLLADEAVAVLIDHVERLLELLDLRLVKHREDVRRRPLRPLLRRLPLRLAARHPRGLAGTPQARSATDDAVSSPGSNRIDIKVSRHHATSVLNFQSID